MSSSIPQLDEGTIDEISQWLENIPLSRHRKNMARDFSDAILAAEIVAHFLPRYIDLHNFMPANSSVLKKYNWETLNKKCLHLLNFQISPPLIQEIVDFRPGAVEYVLYNLRLKIEVAVSQGKFKPRRHHHRSASASRASSTLSLTSLNSEENLSGVATPTRNSARAPRNMSSNAMMSLCKFAISSPSNDKRLCEDLVPARLLHSAQQDLINKDEQIQTLLQRNRHLDQVIKLKDDRILELTQRLDRLAQVFYSHQQKRLVEGASPKRHPGYWDEQQSSTALALQQTLKALRAENDSREAALSPSTSSSLESHPSPSHQPHGHS